MSEPNQNPFINGMRGDPEDFDLQETLYDIAAVIEFMGAAVTLGGEELLEQTQRHPGRGFQCIMAGVRDACEFLADRAPQFQRTGAKPPRPHDESRPGGSIQ